MADDAGGAPGYAAPIGAGQPARMLVVTSLGWFLVQTGRYLLPPLAPAITADLAIGNAAFGVALSLLWAVYALTNFPGGIASDDLGFRTVLVASLVVAGVGFAGLGWAPTYGALLALLAVIGSGVGFFLVGSRTYLSALYGERRGRAIGIHNAAGDVGGVVAPLVATAAVGLASWRTPYLGLGVAALLVAGIFHARTGGQYAVRVPPLRRATRGAVAELASLEIAALVGVYGVYVLVVQGVASFIPLYLTQAKGLGLGTANLALSGFFLAGVVVKPASGWASDIVGRRVLTVGSLVTAGLALAGLVLAGDIAAVFVAVVAFSALVKLFPAATQAYLFDRFSDDASGSAFGLSRTAYVLVGSLGPAAVGVGSEAVGFGATFAALAAGLVLAATVFGALARATAG